METLTYFSQRLGETFSELGYKVFYYQLKEAEVSFRKLKKFIKPGNTALITFNFIGLCEEEQIYHPQYGYIWEQYKLPIYTILVDHPLYYHNHLSHPLSGLRYIGIDKNHVHYVEKYYPNVPVCGFLPLAGTELKGELVERDIPVLMTGNYTEPEFCNPYIERLDEEYTAFYHEIIAKMLTYPQRPLEEVAKEFCIREMGELSDDDFRKVLASMNFIDLYVRNTQRTQVVKELVDAGITVQAVGAGWEKLKCRHPEYLKMIPQMDSQTCLMLTKRAQISLNVMPGFKQGAHDRIFNAILNGAISVSDDNYYLRDILPEGCGICYYDMQQLESLPSLVQKLLEHPEQRKEICAAGYEKVSQYHTWRERAFQLAEWIHEME